MITIARCTVNRSRLPTTPRSPDRIEVIGLALALRTAGNVPKTTQVATETTAANSNTRQSGAMVRVNRVLARVQRIHQRPAQRLREGNAERGADHRQQRALQQHLSQHPATRSAKRHANGHFALFAARPRQHQVGEIRAGNQQHQSGDGQKKLQRRVVLRLAGSSPPLQPDTRPAGMP